jgi:hypothetical protein
MFDDAQNHPQIDHLIEEAHLSIVRGEYDNAKAKLVQILELHPNDPDAQRMLAEIPKPMTARQLDDARIQQDKDDYFKRRQQYNDAQM